ncbi:MAG: Ig-like domain-containing protein, partial [Sulfuricella sp.]
MFEQALASPLPNPLPPAGEGANEFDLTGDGQVNSTDRQVLYANTGYTANQAPTPSTQDSALKTHTDLATRTGLKTIAEDLEGDTVYWRILSATHGTAQLGADGQTLSFTPDAGFTGEAMLSLQADDGFATGTPINIKVNVSGAKLLAIHLAELPSLSIGQFTKIHATADFEDEQGVTVTNATWLTVSTADLSGMGDVMASPIAVDDNRDLIRATATGPALVIVTRVDTDGRTVRAVAAINTQAALLPVDPNANPEADYSTSEPMVIQPDVYPGTLTLIPGGTRQLKIHLIDPNSGEQVDIHTASQTVFAGTPESVSYYLDPNTGVTTQTVMPAVPAAISGTRYFVSDETVATVSADGLITALKQGEITVSIVHLASVVDEYGTMTEQAVGQTDIHLTVQTAQLTDDDPLTATPAGITVSKVHGGVVQSATGETVMIGAGALATDTPVSIQRIAVTDLDALGLSAPAPGALQALGAFSLDIGDATSDYPLQLAIPVQAGSTAQSGDEVLFLRKGSVLTEDGSYQDTWWLVDNGFVGTDAQGNLVARTASPPYYGLADSGEYLVCNRLPGVISGSLDLTIAAGEWLTFEGLGGLGISFSGGANGVNVASNFIGTLASWASGGTASRYHFGVPQFAKIVLPKVPPGEMTSVDIDAALPPIVTPEGNVVYPKVTAARVDDVSGELKFTISNPSPGVFKGKIVVRALFADGTYRDVQTFAGDVSGEITITPPADFAIGSVTWQLVRTITPTTCASSGIFMDGQPREFGGNTIKISPKPGMTAVLTRKGVDFFRENEKVNQTNLVSLLGTPNDFGGTYLTGGKVQPVVFSEDFSRVYIGGKGAVFVIDTLSFKLIASVALPAGKNISSLAVAGNRLIIGEGERFGSGAGNRLLVLDIDPGSPNYHKNPVSLKSTEVESSPYGVSGMTVGADGKTLVVATPINPNSVTLGDKTKRGNVLVFDLSTLDLNTGQIAAPTTATLPADGISGKSPQLITATNDPDRYLVADIADYSRGLSTLVITRDANQNITGARMTAIPLSQPTGNIYIDRLDIQRAQSAVLVEQDGVEYAIVSDDNYHFLDPYWKAMYEAPDFLYTPFGPPIAIGGSASARKVNVGGKLGIVKDPFGTAEYLGATLPLDGYGIVNLSLSEDGKVLLGQLKGGFSGNILSSEANTQKPNQTHAWNVEALIQAALDTPETDRMTRHIKLPTEAEQLLPTYPFAPAGTAFDHGLIEVSSNQAHMGDIIEVNVRELAAKQLLGFTVDGQLSAAQQSQVLAKMETLKDFAFALGVKEGLTDTTTQEKRAFSLLTNPADHKVVSLKADSKTEADFETEGRFYAVPNITADNLLALRRGDQVPDKSGSITLNFNEKQADGSIKGRTVTVALKVTDYVKADNTVFFGDRDLKNPGYTAFTLSNTVRTGIANPTASQLLDVYRVEQRLKYLGFSSFDKTHSNQTREFQVDGNWTNVETTALRGFYTATHYTSAAYTSGGFGYEGSAGANTVAKAAQTVVGTNDARANTNFNWLNAFNAPHMIDMYSALPVPRPPDTATIQNRFQNGAGTIEAYASSWIYDWLQAWRQTQEGFSGLPAQDQANVLMTSAIKINGLTSPPGYSSTHQHEAGGHSTLMALDLGFRYNFINNANTQTTTRNNQTGPLVSGEAGWSVQNAINWSARLTDQQNPGERNALRNFLSLYSLTVNDGSPANLNGGWEDIRVQNGNIVKQAIFGNGTQAQPVIQNVWLGTNGYNTYPRMHNILAGLGVTAATSPPTHWNHFHIDFRTPGREPIKLQQNLLASDGPMELSQDNFIEQARVVLSQELGIKTGELAMFSLEPPNAPPQIVFVAQADAHLAQKKRAIGICMTTEYIAPNGRLAEGQGAIGPNYQAMDYFALYEKREIALPPYSAIQLVRGPKHGTVTPYWNPGDGIDSWRYVPAGGYTGGDSVEFLVDVQGMPVRVVYFFKVTKLNIDDGSAEGLCKKFEWKISLQNVPADASAIQSLLSFTGITSATNIEVSDLANGAVGSTQGNTITLDDNAAGHNWYIDTTPSQNEEYLPTSNPNEWVAKAGSAAAGKMDLLSVLLHEYGHALGIEHSPNPNDYMAATLQPGVRHLPSSEELALMTQLVGEIKTGQNNAPNTPINPSLPIGTTLSALLLGRLRRTNYGSWSPVFDSVQIPA